MAIEDIWFSKYRVISKLGCGGTSEVYLARHVVLDTYRAIKRIPKKHKAYGKLMKEVHILKSLKHPNIPIVYDIEEDEKYSYIIEEYLPGESLKAFRMRLSHLDERSIVDFTFQICDLIQYLHSFQTKILYLDLKPENIVIYKGQLKLVDFGASVYDAEYNENFCDMGTPGYFAPERLNHQADERSDIYSIGCLLYFLVTGTAYQSTCVSEKWAWILVRNRKIYKLIERCIKVVPSQRFQSVTELKNCLKKVQGKEKANHVSSVMSYSIALAGSDRRTGVTHIALAITSFMARVNRSAVYVEWNENNHLRELVTCDSRVKKKEEYYQLYHTKMREKEQCLEESEMEQYRFLIKDYGKLTERNLEEFLKEKHPVIVSGEKPWEWNKGLYWMDKLCDCENVMYIVNLSNEAKLHQIAEGVFCNHCIHMPYFADPFFEKGIGKEGAVLEKLIQYIVSNEKGEGVSTKRKVPYKKTHTI